MLTETSNQEIKLSKGLLCSQQSNHFIQISCGTNPFKVVNYSYLYLYTSLLVKVRAVLN